MYNFSGEYLLRFVKEMFLACGAKEDESEIVAFELIEASLMGVDSHGVIRVPQYVDNILSGAVNCGSNPVFLKETSETAIVDCGWNFGMVSAVRLADIAYEKAASSNIACVVGINCHHAGRLGSYVHRLAKRGMIAMAFASGSRFCHWVTPWGGREGRLATNPLAYGIPAKGNPFVLDMSTSMIAEGKIRALRNKGLKVPEGYILDADGNPATDPDQFYGPPMGTILPFGSQLGYKGFGLGLLVEIMGRSLAGQAVADEGKKYKLGNGLSVIAINPDAFCGTGVFTELMEEMEAYMTSSLPAPGHEGVIMPGSLDYRIKEKRISEGIPVDEKTWESILNSAEKAGIKVESVEK